MIAAEILLKHSNFDELTPWQKLEIFRERYIDPTSLDMHLLGLDAIDESIRANIGIEGLYLLGDRSLDYILASANVRGTLSENSMELFDLTISQVIYRFTAALKFQLSNCDLKQLRINSWGKECCRQWLRPRYSEKYEKIVEVANVEIVARLERYQKLATRLGLRITRSVALEISELNEDLNLKLAS